MSQRKSSVLSITWALRAVLRLPRPDLNGSQLCGGSHYRVTCVRVVLLSEKTLCLSKIALR